MSFRSYISAFLVSLFWSASLYPILITVDKYSRNGQTVFLLGDYHENGPHLAQEEKAQIELVLAALNERARVKQRKIQILYEKASTTVHRINSRNWEKVYRFTINIDEALAELNNPDISLHDVETRAASNELACIFHCKGDLEYAGSYFDSDKAPKELKDMTFKDLFEELTSQAQQIDEDIKNIPNEAEKERCKEQLEKGRRNVAFLQQEISRMDWPQDRPVVDLAEQLCEDYCESLLKTVTRHTDSFFESYIGHRILKTEPDTDIVVIAGALHMHSITQYMIGLGWSRDAYCGDCEGDFVTKNDLDSIMRHQGLTERAGLYLKEFANRSQRSISTVYGAIATYLKNLTASSNQSE